MTSVDTFANFAASTLLSSISAGGTSLSLQAGDGSKFPSSGPFMLLIGTLGGTHELAQCTARSGDTLTIARGLESTSAAAWGAGTAVQQVTTAGNLSNLWIASTMVYNIKAYGAKCDGSTDDTTAIQAAITAAQAAGGMVWHPGGTAIISAPLNVTVDNVQFGGTGWGSVYKASASFSGSHMLYVQSGGTFRYGLRMQDVYFDCNSVASLNGVNLESTYHALLDHVRVKNCVGIGIWVNGLSNKFGAYNTLHACTVTDGVGATAIGIKTTNSEWLVLDHCNIITYTATGQFGVNINNFNCIVIGCRFDNIDTSLYMSFSSRCVVSGNQFDRAYTRFINLRGNQSTTVSGNVFNTNQGGAGTEIIYVNDGNNLGNSIVGNTVEPGTTWPWFVNESSNTGGPGNIYDGNHTGGLKLNLKTGVAKDNPGFNPLVTLAAPAAPGVSNSGTGGTIAAGTYPVKLTYVNAFGETTVSSSTSTTTSGTTSSITITAPDQAGNAVGWYAYVSNDGGVTYHRQQTAGSPSQFLNNLVLTSIGTSGATPPGANTTNGITQPSVPASATVFRNTFGVAAMVYVSGGTVSAIAIGGQTTGLTSGSFRVPAYSSITLTYTVAPSWQWVAE